MIRSWFKRLQGLLDPHREPLQETPVHGDKKPVYGEVQDHDFTVASLNREAALRQATIGKSYIRHDKTSERLAELKEGTVTLPPHKSWTGHYTDWTADPFNDLNWRFQYHTLRWINPYLWDALDGNEESKSEWKRIVRSWAEENIPPQHAEDKYAWMDMTDGNRAIQTSLGAPLMDDGDQWYVDFLVAHRNWLLDDTKIVPGNHGLHQNLGLFVVSVVLKDQTGITRSMERLGAQVLDAFDDQGLNEEGSVAYHQSNVVWWLQARERLQLEGYDFPRDARDRLEKAGEAMAYLLLPNGTMPQVGDGGRGKGRRGIHPLLDQVLKREVTNPDLPLFKHFNNGFAVSRSGWGQSRPFEAESHTIVRHGIDLQRHSHNDRGSIHLYTMGRRWITDGGFHSYQQRNRDRNYTKSRSAHSLVSLPRLKYDKTGDVPAQLIQNEDGLHAIEIFDGNFESADWRRRVVFLPRLDVWIIWDRVQSDNPQLIRQQWLVDVGVQVTQHDSTNLVLDDSSNKLYMSWFGDKPQLDIAEGNRKSNSKRGLIGIGWKKMRNGTSVHANFKADKVDSVTVISSRLDQDIRVRLEKRSPMKSFELSIEHMDTRYKFKAKPKTTVITQKRL